MSRIKQEIDRALEHYGDQSTVFRVVREALECVQVDQYDLGCYKMNAIYFCKPERLSRVSTTIRRLLPIDRPVTTERLKQAMESKSCV